MLSLLTRLRRTRPISWPPNLYELPSAGDDLLGFFGPIVSREWRFRGWLDVLV